jgi:DNA repair exonuclease SbcCD ATPase subunit
MGNTQIQLQSLHLVYFKGCKDFKINFLNDITTVRGDNGTRKSTIFDSFSWLFFGKDSNDASDTKFSVKTINLETMEIIQRVDHSVEGVFLMNGEKTTVKRQLQEKWTKKKGALEKVYTGNVTNYYWNEVPLSQREYQDKISQFISEDVFKLITNPYSFNSLHWERQREILTELVGGISDQSIVRGNVGFADLLSKLTNKTFDEYKKQMKFTLKRLKADKDGIPSRIDEQLRGKPDALDFKSIESEIKKNEKTLETIDENISQVNKSADALHKKYDGFRQEKSDLNLKNSDIFFQVQKQVQDDLSKQVNPADATILEIDENNLNIQKFQRVILKLENQIESDKASIKTVIAKRKVKSNEWDEENASELKFEDGDFACPTCKRPLEVEDQETEREKMHLDFIKDKQNAIASINREGLALKNHQETLQIDIDQTEKRIVDGKKALKSLKNTATNLQSELERLQSNSTPALKKDEEIKKLIDVHAEYNENLKLIAKLDKSLSNQKGVDVSSHKITRNNVLETISYLKISLSQRAKIAEIDNRVAELEKEEKENSQLIAAAEKELDTIQQFEVAKMTLTEGIINDKFEKVKFKMFTELVDGTKVPSCLCLFGGVPFHSVNSAGQIEAGLDIINTLCDYYNTQSVIFIDGAESITEIPSTKSQQIRLLVEKGTKPLIVE